ncbi:MAG: archaeosine synthase subunit alpha [Halobacteriales archaeon]|nr:archaeosine synthase subunit alpha [Halobacteriales archaeon]
MGRGRERYFEVLERDGTARLGELRLDEPRETPALVGDLLEDYGSLWTDDRATPQGDTSRITVLPHRAAPPGTPAEVVEEKQPKHDPRDFPAAAVVSAEQPEPSGHDVYILTGVRGGNSRDVVEAVKRARRSLEPDSALFLPASATPRNVATLAYLGFDAFDEDHAVVSGKGGTYMTRELEVGVEQLDELPCACPVCADATPDDLTRDEISRHNVNALRAELTNIRDRIRNGRIRDYVEGQMRASRWQVEAVRLLDGTEYVEERSPVARRTEMATNSSESLDRAEIRRFARRVVERYRAPRDDTVVLLPCSAGKPYSQSRSHGDFRDAIRRRAHEVIVTSPLGVVPRGLENVYPTAHYDTPVTGRWDAKEVEFVGGVLADYLENNPYDRIVAHVEERGYGDVVEKAVEKTGVNVEYTVADGAHPTDDESLDALKDALHGEERATHEDEKRAYVRATADYQFGRGAGDVIDEARVEGRLPRLRVVHDTDDAHLATLTPGYGTLAVSVEGAHEFDAPRVEIDDFVPEGSVLAPGVKEADSAIRVGDEVLFEGPSAVGVGRARMHGDEMRRSRRGVAVSVRHASDV